MFKGNYQCAQTHHQPYESSSSDSDTADRIGTKATRFVKEYRTDDQLLISSDSEEAKLLNLPDLYDEPVSSHSSLKARGDCKSIITDNPKHTEFKQEFRECLNSFYFEVSSNSNSEDSSSETISPEIDVEDPLKLESNTYEKRNASGQSQVHTKTSQAANIDDELYSRKTSARPFKNYPIDASEIIPGFDTAKLSISGGKPESYNEFRRRMLGSRLANKSENNRNMIRFHIPESADNFYKERRKRNNLAAKRSRDARRAKEDELAIRCSYLEQENMFLKKQIAEMEDERRRLGDQRKSISHQ